MIEQLFPGGKGGGTVDTIQAGTGISVDATNPASPIVSSTVTDTNDKVRITANDSLPNYLKSKLVAGTGITITEDNDGSNESLTIAASGGGGGSSVTTYTVTTADVENTTTQTTIMTFTVPANTWSDGQVVWLNPMLEAIRPTTGDTNSIVIEATGLTNITGSITLPTTTAGYGFYRGPIYFRLGTSLYSLVGTSNGLSSNASNVFNISNSTWVKTASYDFTQNFVVSYKVTLNSAASNHYVRVLKAYANKANISEALL